MVRRVLILGLLGLAGAWMVVNEARACHGRRHGGGSYTYSGGCYGGGWGGCYGGGYGGCYGGGYAAPVGYAPPTGYYGAPQGAPQAPVPPPAPPSPAYTPPPR